MIEKGMEFNLKQGVRMAIIECRNGKCVDIAIIEKVTPTGQITTDKGRYKRDNWNGRYYGIGEATGTLEILTDEYEKQAIEYQEALRKEREIKQTIIKARNLCHDVLYGKISLTHDQALKIIGILNKTV